MRAPTGQADRSRLRIVVHDYAGHPFQIQLSRALARRGHVVDHQYSETNVTGHGDMRTRPDDPESLTVTPVNLRRPFARYRAVQRIGQEVEYAFRARRAISAFGPDVVIMCNLSLLANYLLVCLLRAQRIHYVFWHQDVYSEGVRATVGRSMPRLARPAAAAAEAMEKGIARNARAVIGITEAFTAKYREWRLPASGYTVIPNWATIEELPAQPAIAPEQPRRRTILYAGTLGIKHDPAILLALARSPLLTDTRVVVASEGRGRDWLERHRAEVDESRLELRGYVAFPELPELLGAADVLLGILEPAASRFSVPSKVLTYLCAARPVVLVIEPANAAAALLTENKAGVVVPPEQVDELPAAVRFILDDSAVAGRLAANARALAERTFDIDDIADRFEAVLTSAAGRPAAEGISP
jgi:glycosyltransferase involved in cell wall biosynthesis